MRWSFLPLLPSLLVWPSSGRVTPGLWVKLTPKAPQRERLLVWGTRIESPPLLQDYKHLTRKGKHPLLASSTASSRQVKVRPQETLFDWTSLLNNTAVTLGSCVCRWLRRWCRGPLLSCFCRSQMNTFYTEIEIQLSSAFEMFNRIIVYHIDINMKRERQCITFIVFNIMKCIKLYINQGFPNLGSWRNCRGFVSSNEKLISK